MVRYDEINDVIIDNIARLFESTGLKQQAIADAIGASQCTVNRIINRKYKTNMSIGTIVNICKYFNYNITDLFIKHEN